MKNPIQVLLIQDHLVTEHACTGVHTHTGEHACTPAHPAADIDLLCDMLSTSAAGSFQVSWSDCLPAGLVHLSQEQVDVLLLDLAFAGGAEIEAITRVRALVPHVPLVVLTRPEDETTAGQALRLGACDCLSKGELSASLLRRVVSYAFERKQANTALDRQMEQLETLNHASSLITASLELDQVLAEIVGLTCQVAASDYASIMLLDEKGKPALHTENLPNVPLVDYQARQEGFTSWILHSQRPIVVDDIDADGRIYPQPGNGAPKIANPLVVQAGVRSFIGLPMLAQNQLLGVLFLHSKRPNHFNQVALLAAFVNQAAIAIRNARLHQQIQRRVQELTYLNQIGRMMTSSLDLDQVLETVLTETAHVLSTEGCSIILIEPQTEELVFRAVVGPLAQQIKDMRLPIEHGIVGWVARQGQPLLVPDVHRDPRFYEMVDQQTGFETRSILAVPLKVQDRVIGVIEIVNKTGGEFTTADADLLASMAQSAAIAIDNARLYQDLQERVHELQEAQAQLIQSAKLAVIGELAAGVAHEVNNPLTGIIGFTDMLLQSVSEDDPMKEDLQIIEQEALRTRSIVTGLLDFARRAEPHIAPADIHTVLQRSTALIEYQTRKNQIQIQEDYDRTLPLIPLDMEQIRQVFLNLLTNAVQAMPEGGILRIETSRQPGKGRSVGMQRDWVAISFHDTGIGIQPENLSRLFEPFFTTKKAGHGTGLGLSISQHIVQQHGGQIQVRSTVGQGSTFTVLLPMTLRSGATSGAQTDQEGL